MQDANGAGEVFHEHDHDTCCHEALSHADDLCKTAGLRLTPVRRRTLEILLESHQALGAYDVLARLSDEGFGTQPPVAYRALDFLVENGLAHRVTRLNAFTACMHPGETHRPFFLICTGCNLVAETPGRRVAEAMEAAAADAGFAIERVSSEALGLCATCQGAS